VLRAYLDLVRPANVATALADVLAGFALAGLGNARALPWLLAASACLYAGGVALNDVFDRRLDAAERPERPLPSGRISVAAAAVFGATLLALGVLLAANGAGLAGQVALAIVVAVLAYDAATKRHAVLGPLNMGACRGLNLALGMAVVPGALGEHWPIALIPTAYIAGVTVLSRGEVTAGHRVAPVVALSLVAGALAALSAVAVGPGRYALAGLVLTALLAARVLPPFIQTLRTPGPGPVRAAVKRGVLSLVLLDAALAAAFAGPAYGVVLLVAAFAAAWLGRSFAVT
jgi:4-hydroxybenzoate polyprenyltransferase